jgi:hypothetical protein
MKTVKGLHNAITHYRHVIYIFVYILIGLVVGGGGLSVLVYITFVINQKKPENAHGTYF